MKKTITFFTLILTLVTFNLLKLEAAGEPAATKAFVDNSKNNLILNRKQMTFVGIRSGEGYFSADGKKMIYQSEREDGNPFYQMYLLDLVTGKSTRLSTGTGMTTCGWIHPNGKKVMWSSTHLDPKFNEKVKTEFSERSLPIKKKYSWNYDDQYEIFESDLNGKKLKRLTRDLGYDAEGSYSPDGKHIAFASNRSQFSSDEYSAEEKKLIERDSSYAMEIYIMKSDGSGVKRLTQSKGYDGGPFFSADGQKITWRRFSPDGSRAEIYTMNIDGSEQKQITKLNVMSWAPFFHPSGDYIIFTTSALGYANFELFIVAAEDNSTPIRVTHEDGFDGLPTFSPDGQKISWTRRNEKGESQIYIADWNHQEALGLVQANTVSAPKTEDMNLNASITEEDTRQIVYYLASEAFKGRKTGSAEEKIYTDQIARLFKMWGLQPAMGGNFIHEFEFVSGVKAGIKNSLQLKGRLEKKLTLNQDYQISSYSKSGVFQTAPMVFVGYGVKAPATDKWVAYDSYEGLDVQGKWVLMLEHAPLSEVKEQRQHWLTFAQLQHKVSLAKNNQAIGVILISDRGLKEIKFDGALSESPLPVVKISTEIMTELLKASQKKYTNFKSLELAFESTKEKTGFILDSQYVSSEIELVHERSVGRNVVALLSPKNKNTKALFVGAHGDHLGDGLSTASSLARSQEQGQFHFGADDNASGVAGVLELAHYFSTEPAIKALQKPIYFAVWSGEESGNLGSSHFIKDWKTLKKTDLNANVEASFNMDMIGRYRDQLHVQGVGSAKEWSGLSEEVSLVKGLPLALTSDPYLPTDAVSFYLANVPSISFTTGAHEEYHTPRDRAELINYSGLVKTIDVVKTYIEKLAYVKAGLLQYVKVAGDSSKTMSGRSFRVYLGTIPDYSQEGVKGLKISGTSKDSPAEKAGLKSGDIVTEFDSLKIENIYDYVYALQAVKPDKPVKIHIRRGDQSLQLEITPILKDK